MPVLSSPLHDPGSLCLLLLAGGLGTLAYLVLHQNPRIAAVLWSTVICFVPVWMGVNIHFGFAPAVLVGFLILVSLPPVRGTLLKADLLFAAVGLLALLPTAVGGTSAFATFPLLTEIILGYLVGRMLATRIGPDRVIGCLTVALTVAAALAVAEFLLGWNPFVLLNSHTPLYSEWGDLQERGGILRAEGAFGHSIALGGSLAMAVPWALTRPWRVRSRLLATAVLLLGTVVTFSRAGLICAVLGLLLSVVFLQRHLPTRLRVGVVSIVLVGAAALLPRVAGVFDEAGSEAGESAGYRTRLLSLIPHMTTVGVSPQLHEGADGTRRIDGFRSIDNALLLFGLRYGWLPLALVLVGLLVVIIAVLAGHGTPPAVALAAQIPALATVALITQYGILLTFLVGLTVATYDPAVRRQREPPPPPRTLATHAPRTRGTYEIP